jgi:glycosyltransferase involved in cell wall biosynthesis
VDAPELRELASPPEDGAALFLGELSARKGADILLTATNELLSIFPRVLVAGDGPLRDDFAAKSHQLSRFDYVGFVEGEAKAECMRQAAVVLLPSMRDPWPLAACEALVSRRPLVVGQGVGSTPDLRALAGSAVVSMQSQDAAGLVQAARVAKAQHVSEDLRHAFSPDASALKMARIIRKRSNPRPHDSANTA